MSPRTAFAVGSILCGILASTNAQSPTNASTSATSSFRAIFTVPADADASAPLLPNIYDSQAVDAQTVCPGYTASNIQRTTNGMTAQLSLAGTACNIYGNDVDFLNLTVEYQSYDRLHVEITPTYVDVTNSSYYILPDALVTKPTVEEGAEFSSLDSDLDFVYNNDPTFSFSVIRKSTGDVLFSTEGSKLVYEDQFIELVSPLPENYNLYGLGEVIHNVRLGNNFTRTLWAADTGDNIDRNLYGTHPFYLDTRYYEVNETTGNLTYAANATDASADYVSYSHGVWLRNAHGQEVLMRPSNITWRTLGGSIDLFFYAGPTAEKVTKSYINSAAGLPAMQQYFTFGYHQCRWGYANWTELQDIIDNFERFSIPLETVWTDIDYMDQYRDFTHDQNTFPYSEAIDFFDRLHGSGLHYVPIVDAAIYYPNPENASDTYETFNRGLATNSFMLNPDGSLYVGDVWPGYTVFMDFPGAIYNGSGTFEWWIDEVTRWFQDIPFDGIWIDMSEASSFCVGSCGSNNLTMNPVHPPFSLPGEPGNIIHGYPEGFNLTNATEAASASAAASAQDSAKSALAGPPATTTTTPTYIRTTPTPGVRNLIYPPYVIDNVQGALDVHAVSPNATHHGGTVEYDFHNLHGHFLLNATYHGLLNIRPEQRPFIIGRSTHVGSGKWAGHWGGDNTALWAYMYFSIPQALSFSLFGIPMFGVDTCGFNGNTDEELCNRWMQLSAFFPFYRNHNVISANPQEPFRWASVAEATRTAMQIRYSLLPYIYTTFYLAHKTGSTVMRALPWEFTKDPTLAAADRQFLFGDALMITPVLVQGAISVDGVFPGAGKGEVWYDYYNQTAITAGPGENITIDAPLGHIPVYLRGGYILPTQEPAMTTRDARKKPWGLLVASGLGGNARGSLYIDDGESLHPNATLCVDFSLTNSALYASARGTYNDTNPLANVTILGVQNEVSNVTLNGADLSTGWYYNSISKVLDIQQLANSTAKGAWAQDWVLRWN